jgi:hypothetical protein
MSLAIITRFKNERHIMFEWINHHLLEDIDKIFLIDHNSNDNYLEENNWIEPLILHDKIEFLKSNIDDQAEDYNYYLEKIKKYDWIIQIDMDEFIFTPHQNTTLKNILNEKYYDYDFINIHWKLFTHSNVFQPNSVIENNIFTHEDDIDPTSPSTGIKCIGKTLYLEKIKIHTMIFDRKVNSITFPNCFNEDIQNNHYRTQSDEYLYGVKEIRGGGVNKEKYKNFTNHKRDIYTKKCTILLNKRLDLVNECYNMNIKPKIYENSTFYKIINFNEEYEDI